MQNNRNAILQGIPQKLLEVLIVRTRDLLGKQLVFRERLFLLQDTMHSSRHASFQEKSLRITHNLAVVGGCGLILSLIIGLMGVNLDGMPFVKKASKAFWSFFGLLVVLAIAMALVCRKYCALKLASKKEKVSWFFEQRAREQAADGTREMEIEEFEKNLDDVKMWRDHFDNIFHQQEIRSKEEEMEKKKAMLEEWEDVEKALAL